MTNRSWFQNPSRTLLLCEYLIEHPEVVGFTNNQMRCWLKLSSEGRENSRIAACSSVLEKAGIISKFTGKRPHTYVVHRHELLGYFESHTFRNTNEGYIRSFRACIKKHRKESVAGLQRSDYDHIHEMHRRMEDLEDMVLQLLDLVTNPEVPKND